MQARHLEPRPCTGVSGPLVSRATHHRKDTGREEGSLALHLIPGKPGVLGLGSLMGPTWSPGDFPGDA